MRKSDRMACLRLPDARAARAAIIPAALVLGVLAGTPAMAQPGWGGRGWGGPGWNDPTWGGPVTAPSARRGKDPREGRIQVDRFVRDDAEAQRLGHGYITIVSRDSDSAPAHPATWGGSGQDGNDWVAPERRARFEAAIETSLINAGYDTLGSPGPESQVAVLSIHQRVLVPAEQKRSPVSGSAAMSVGTYGQSYGLAINVDLTKPLTALISTRLDLRILDHADGHVLWEGNAEIATYEGDEDWTDDRIATRLAEALLDRFPEGQPVTVPITEVGIPDHPPVLPEDAQRGGPEG